jgi:hypothetical protein
MTRCGSCNGVIKRVDLECYTCGDPVPGASKPFWRRRREATPKAAAPVTPFSNLLFLASLALTGVSFLSSQKMPLSLALTLSGILLTARIVTDRRAARRINLR